MIEEDLFVELAKACVRVSRVLKTMTGGSGVDYLSDPDKKRIEDLGRCANRAHPSQLTVTSGVRIMCRVESVLSEHTTRTRDSPEHHSGSAKEWLIASRAEIEEILRGFDVRGFQPIILPPADHLLDVGYVSVLCW